jgi:hypothetical protein
MTRGGVMMVPHTRHSLLASGLRVVAPLLPSARWMKTSLPPEPPGVTESTRTHAPGHNVRGVGDAPGAALHTRVELGRKRLRRASMQGDRQHRGAARTVSGHAHPSASGCEHGCQAGPQLHTHLVAHAWRAKREHHRHDAGRSGPPAARTRQSRPSIIDG